ncbi:MAG: hypothetical protein MMC33_006419 [Icmadophila ericetorum]|nr:hypothetical protein [Icmadophila ericetorum]
MSNENSPPTSPTARRASFAPGQKLSDLFSRSPGSSSGAAGIPPYPGSIAAAAATQQRRRMSISTLGLSGSPTQTSPFTARPRQESTSSSGSAAGSSPFDESAIEDGDAPPTPSTPFARRMSFGAKALREVKGGSNYNGRGNLPSSGHASRPSQKLSNIPDSTPGDGFNWSDQLMSRAQRSSSITAAPPNSIQAPAQPARAQSIAVPSPAKEPAKPAKVPDHFQERILKGDFYMD